MSRELRPTTQLNLLCREPNNAVCECNAPKWAGKVISGSSVCDVSDSRVDNPTYEASGRREVSREELREIKRRGSSFNGPALPCEQIGPGRLPPEGSLLK